MGGLFLESGRTIRSFRPSFRGGEEFLAAFGVVGGRLTSPAHVQLVSSLVDGGLDVQQALDRPRFRVSSTVRLEEGVVRRASSRDRRLHDDLQLRLDRVRLWAGGGG